jgi:hypothetical protein
VLVGCLKECQGYGISQLPGPSQKRNSAGRGSSLLIFLGAVPSSYAGSLVQQTLLEPNCVPMFAVPLPVFGRAGSVPRVDAAAHPSLTVTMKEIDPAVLPQRGPNLCGIKFRKTRVWAYESTDSRTGEVLGPANWPAVTLVATRGTSIPITYCCWPRDSGVSATCSTLDR